MQSLAFRFDLKRGLAAPLLFLALAVATKGSINASPVLWLVGLVTLGAAAFCMQGAAPRLTPIGATILGFALWLAVSNLWLNPSYTAAATFNAAFLLGGFFLGYKAGTEKSALVFCTALAFVSCLAVWAIGQQISRDEIRAHGFFETPATLATTINLVLIPGLVLVATRSRAKLLIAVLLVLITAFWAAASRGGWLALAVAAVITSGLLRRVRIRVDATSGALIVAMFMAGWLAAWLGPRIWDWSGIGQDFARQSATARLGLYGFAIETMAGAFPLLGTGYLSFRHLLDSAVVPIVGFEEGSTTYFVHNDYLQVLLELGIPGLAGLVAMVALPAIQAWRAAPGLSAELRLKCIAIVAAASSMAVHALVDFPFYIPVCLVMYGAAVGMLDAMLYRNQEIAGDSPARGAPATLRRATLAGVATLAAWVLATPAAAESAARYGHHHWRESNPERAAYWFEVARRIEPRDWRYHWYAGQFWFAQARLNPDSAAPRLAAAAFSAGYAANLREPSNLIGMMATHVRFRQQLPAPADAATLRTWANRVLALAPRDAAMRMEASAVLEHFARK